MGEGKLIKDDYIGASSSLSRRFAAMHKNHRWIVNYTRTRVSSRKVLLIFGRTSHVLINVPYDISSFYLY